MLLIVLTLTVISYLDHYDNNLLANTGWNIPVLHAICLVYLLKVHLLSPLSSEFCVSGISLQSRLGRLGSSTVSIKSILTSPAHSGQDYHISFEGKARLSKDPCWLFLLWPLTAWRAGKRPRHSAALSQRFEAELCCSSWPAYKCISVVQRSRLCSWPWS